MACFPCAPADEPNEPTSRRPRESAGDPEVRARHAAYWKRNVRYVGMLLVVWFTVS